jgi:hypothetical protein
MRALPAGFCLPTKTDKLPIRQPMAAEIKHDRFRIIARKTGKKDWPASVGGLVAPGPNSDVLAGERERVGTSR